MVKDNKNSGTSESISKSVPETELHHELEAIRDRDFLQQGMLNFVEILEKNKAAAAGLVLLALLAGVGFVGWEFLDERREKSAQEAFYAVEKSFTDLRDKFDQARFASLNGAKVDELIKAGTAVRASGDLTKDYGSVVDNLEAFARKHLGTTASVQAAMLAAETRVNYKQPDQALATLQETVNATKVKSVIGALARMAIGNTEAASGKCDQALSSWEEVLKTKEVSFLHSEAALRAGLCLEKTGNKPKAIEMYRKASGESDKSSSAQTARTLLRALELGT